MLEPISEVENSLILRAKQGDRSAYGALVSCCYEPVMAVVYRLCSDTQMAEDAVQEAFLRAWLKLPGFRPQAPFRHWVYRIAVNIALDMLRRKPEESLEQYEDVPMLAEKTPGPEAAYLEKEQAQRVQAAVRALPDAARAVLVLREYGGLSYEAIAAVLEIPLGTVMSRLNYARTRLREQLLKEQHEMERTYA